MSSSDTIIIPSSNIIRVQRGLVVRVFQPDDNESANCVHIMADETAKGPKSRSKWGWAAKTVFLLVVAGVLVSACPQYFESAFGQMGAMGDVFCECVNAAADKGVILSLSTAEAIRSKVAQLARFVEEVHAHITKELIEAGSETVAYDVVPFSKA